jgi:glycosyltransferase involved in cell wall biosynthesis
MHSLDNVTYLGAQSTDKTMALIAESRVLVNTSQAEGFPNTMLEAWSLGVPVATLSVDPGGVIEREQIGLVSGSDAQLWCDVRRLACDESLNRQLGSRGMSYVKRRHSLEAVCDALSGALCCRLHLSAADEDEAGMEEIFSFANAGTTTDPARLAPLRDRAGPVRENWTSRP